MFRYLYILEVFFSNFSGCSDIFRRKRSRLKSKMRSNAVVAAQQALYMDIKSALDSIKYHTRVMSRLDPFTPNSIIKD